MKEVGYKYLFLHNIMYSINFCLQDYSRLPVIFILYPYGKPKISQLSIY